MKFFVEPKIDRDNDGMQTDIDTNQERIKTPYIQENTQKIRLALLENKTKRGNFIMNT